MEHLLASVAPGQCFWYAHPRDEDPGNGNGIGDFFSDNISGDLSQLIHLTPDHVEEVNRFKALVIGGGGLFVARHAPLYVDSFAEGLTLPIVILGVGANRLTSKRHATLLRKAVFVSGRDAKSTEALANVLRRGESVVQPEDVALVRDPVLSDTFFTDGQGKCWKQSEADHEQPLCFIVPASNTEFTKEMHRRLVAQVVRPGDVFVNVFPKHQQEVLEQHDYPGEILQILDPMEFTERLCSCRAIISTRLHGVVLGLHMGVPTFGASGTSHGNKVPDVVIDTMRLPEQYLLIDDKLTREVVDQEVGVVRELYATHGRREAVHARLSALGGEFETQARHVLFDVIGAKQHPQQPQSNFEEQRHNRGQHEAKEFFPGAEIAEFLPADLAKGGSRVSDRVSSSGLPSSGISTATATELGGRTVGVANPTDTGHLTTKMADGEAEDKRAATAAVVVSQESTTAKVTDGALFPVDAKNGGMEMRGNKERPTKANESAEAEGTRAVETALSQGPIQGIEREDGSITAHADSETKAVALRLWNPPTNMFQRSPVAPTSEATTATATAPATARVSLHTEQVEGDEASADEPEGRATLADALLANTEALSRWSAEQGSEVPQQRRPPSPSSFSKAAAAPSAAGTTTGAAKLSTGEEGGGSPAVASVAEALLPTDGGGGGAFKSDGVFVEDPQEKEEQRASGEAVNGGGHGHSGAETTERVGAATKASVSTLRVSRGGSSVPMTTVAGEGGSLNVAITSVLINDDFFAAMLLVAAILGLAFMPSGGAARRPSCDMLVLRDVAGDGEGKGRGDSRAGGDPDLIMKTDQSPRTVRGRSASVTTGTAAATSSKMTFMFNFAMWVSLAMGFSGYGKAYLGDTRDPIGLLILQGATGVLVLCVLARFGVLDLHPGGDLTPAAARQAGLAAVLHTGQALLTNFAVLVGGVAVTNALKAMEPVAAAVFSYLLLGKTCSGSRMAALATIVVGILILTFKGNNAGGDGGYIVISAVFTMAAVCCNALRNVVIKRGNPIPPHQTLFTCSAAATVVGIALMLLRLTFRSMDDLLQRGGLGHGGYDGRDLVSSWVRMDGVNAALCFVGYNLASFNLLLRLSPVGHAVGNSCKRMVVFASGLLLLGEVMCVRQLGGTAVALAGVLAYNLAGTR
eukprot:g14474.t2